MCFGENIARDGMATQVDTYYTDDMDNHLDASRAINGDTSGRLGILLFKNIIGFKHKN